MHVEWLQMKPQSPEQHCITPSGQATYPLHYLESSSGPGCALTEPYRLSAPKPNKNRKLGALLLSFTFLPIMHGY